MSCIDLTSRGLDGLTFPEALKNALSKATIPIVSINLKQNKLDAKCLDFLLPLITNGPLSDVKELILQNCFTEGLGDAACERLKFYFKASTKKLNIQKLDIGYNNITKFGLPDLAEALFYACPELIEINLRYNNIGPDGSMALQNFFVLPKIASIDLTGNDLGDQGCAYISNYAAACVSLQRLILWGNNISDASAPYLAQLIIANQSLDHLDLSSNTLTQPSLELLYNTIEKSNKGLSDVGLYGNSIKDRYILQKFKDMLLKRTKVKQFQNEEKTKISQSTISFPSVAVNQEWTKLEEAKKLLELEKAQFYLMKAEKEKEWNALEAKIEQHVQLIVQKLQQQGQLVLPY